MWRNKEREPWPRMSARGPAQHLYKFNSYFRLSLSFSKSQSSSDFTPVPVMEIVSWAFTSRRLRERMLRPMVPASSIF